MAELMRVVSFNGLGEPDLTEIKTGDILILFNHQEAQVVQLKLLPLDEYGPELTPADNWKDLEKVSFNEIKNHHPECLDSEQHWVFECPANIISLALFNN